METLDEKIARVVKEHVAVVPYDPRWRTRFEQERDHLLSCLPHDLIKEIKKVIGAPAAKDGKAKRNSA